MYRYLQTVLLVIDRMITITGIVGGAELRSLELTKAEQRMVIRGMLKPWKPYGGCP